MMNNNDAGTKKMGASEWEELLKKLYQISDSYDYGNYKNGRNAAIRKKAERELDSAILYFKRLIVESTNEEIRTLFWDYVLHNSFSAEEFLSKRYFNTDFPRFLEKVREKVSELEKAEKNELDKRKS